MKRVDVLQFHFVYGHWRNVSTSSDSSCPHGSNDTNFGKSQKQYARSFLHQKLTENEHKSQNIPFEPLGHEESEYLKLFCDQNGNAEHQATPFYQSGGEGVAVGYLCPQRYWE